MLPVRGRWLGCGRCVLPGCLYLDAFTCDARGGCQGICFYFFYLYMGQFIYLHLFLFLVFYLVYSSWYV